MLKIDRKARWSARNLLENIQEANQDIETAFTFSGLCCVEDLESAESVHSTYSDWEVATSDSLATRRSLAHPEISDQNPSTKSLQRLERPTDHVDSTQYNGTLQLTFLLDKSKQGMLAPEHVDMRLLKDVNEKLANLLASDSGDKSLREDRPPIEGILEPWKTHMQTSILPTKSTESIRKGGKTSFPKDHPNRHRSKHLSQTGKQTLDLFGARAERRPKFSPDRSVFTKVAPQLDTLAKLRRSNKIFFGHVEAMIGYTFKATHYLIQALTAAAVDENNYDDNRGMAQLGESLIMTAIIDNAVTAGATRGDCWSKEWYL